MASILVGDIYPEKIENKIPPLETPKSARDYRKLFYTMSPIFAWNMFLFRNKMFFIPAKINSQQFTLMAILAFYGTPTNVPAWNKSLKILKNANVRKKTNQICYRLENNLFIVKPFVTFGIRKVMKETHHVIQISNTPMQLYRQKSFDKQFTKRTFPYKDSDLFEQYTLEKYTAYRIGANECYILMSTDFTLFSIHVMEETATLNFDTKMLPELCCVKTL